MDLKTAVLLVNLGTPDNPSVRDVRIYLFEFLNDSRVIDIPAIARFFLVNFIIVPFRAPNSAKLIRKFGLTMEFRMEEKDHQFFIMQSRFRKNYSL